MKRHYSTLGLCLILASALGFFPGCSLDTPDAPPSDNPFDPANPETGGDPYKIQAERLPNGVRLTWRTVNWPPLTGYSLYRRTDDSHSSSPLTASPLTRSSLLPGYADYIVPSRADKM